VLGFTFGLHRGYADSLAVTFRDTTVVKTMDPAKAEIEVATCQAAFRLSRTNRLFRVPEIVDSDLEKGEIEFERLSGIATLGQWLADNPRDLDVIRRAGTVLAEVHTDLAIPPENCHRFSGCWGPYDSDHTPLHGDFNTINVCYKADTDEIVVLDWTTGLDFGPQMNFGPRSIDLSCFLHSLLMHQRDCFSAVSLLRKRAEAFLAAYEQRRGSALDRVVPGTGCCACPSSRSARSTTANAAWGPESRRPATCC